MSWEPSARAPQELEKLPAFVNEQLIGLARALEESYRPVFQVNAERGGALVAGTYDWSFGDGQVQASGEGLIIPVNCSLYALSLFLNGGAARAKVDVNVGGVDQTAYALDLAASNLGFVEFPVPLEIFRGESFTFRTVTQSGTSGNNVVGHFPTIENWALRLGATELVAYVRPGLRKKLKKHGFHHAYDVVTRSLIGRVN